MDIHANPVLSAGTGNYMKTTIYYIIVSCHFQSAFQLDALDPVQVYNRCVTRSEKRSDE